MDVDLHIERLVLDGLPLDPGHARIVEGAVEAELGRLVAERGIAGHLQAGGALPAIRASAIELVSGDGPAAVGKQIAQSIFGGIGNVR